MAWDVAKLTHVMMKELIANETWHCVMWSRWRRSRQDLAWWTRCKREGQVRGFGAMDRMAVKLEQDLAPVDEGNGEKQEKLRSMNQYDRVMIWSGSCYCWSCWCMCCIDIGGDGMEWARQRYNLGHFMSSRPWRESSTGGCRVKIRFDLWRKAGLSDWHSWPSDSKSGGQVLQSHVE